MPLPESCASNCSVFLRFPSPFWKDEFFDFLIFSHFLSLTTFLPSSSCPPLASAYFLMFIYLCFMVVTLLKFSLPSCCFNIFSICSLNWTVFWFSLVGIWLSWNIQTSQNNSWCIISTPQGIAIFSLLSIHLSSYRSLVLPTVLFYTVLMLS